VPAWLLWLIAAVGLAGFELASLNLVLIMLAGGAGAAAIAALVGVPVILQVVIFAVVSLALLGLVRPIAQRHMEVSTGHHATGVDALVGQPATVLEAVDSDRGAVKIGGEVWSARSYDETQVLEAGEKVQVIEIKGATALVWRQP
jgi:membrane protein implicated in regulation of membrane protease activity